MAKITAAMVGELRARTDAPMMECKKALTEADGDIVRAEEILRVKLGNKASKASSRVTAEGVIASYVSGNVGSLIEINCETDFVSKSEDFLYYANACAQLVAEQAPSDIMFLSSLKLDDGSTVEEARKTLIGKIGENISIRRFSRFQTKDKLSSYLHGTRIGVVVEYTGGNEQVGKDLAMHIAAMKPLAVSPDQIPSELIERERSVAQQRIDEEVAAGKKAQPADIVAKRIDGTVQKYLKEVSLLNQPFVKNDKQSVEQMLKENSATVKSFSMFVVGEGLEKRQDDFAAEVAAQVAAAKG